MSVHARVSARIYCDGATHYGLEWSGTLDGAMTELRAWLRRQGWLITREGQTYCPDHRPKR